MRYIKKGSEPKSWKEHKATPNATYEGADTDDLRSALIKEQGYLCGYCMKRINHVSKAEARKSVIIKPVTTTRIEHIKCQTVGGVEDTTRSLNYNNMILCCNGVSPTDKEFQQCDVLKGDKEISFSPLNKHVLEIFTFLGYGFMKANTPRLQNEIGDDKKTGVLNLNNLTLIRNRKAVIDTVLNCLSKGTWNKSSLTYELRRWSEKDKDGMYNEYCQIVVSYIIRKLEKI